VVVYAAVDTGLTLPVPTGGYGGGVESPVELRVAVLHRGQPVVYPGRIDHARSLNGADVTGAVVDDDALYLASRGTDQVLGVRFAEMDRSGLRGGFFVSNSPRTTQESAGGGLNGLAFGGDGRLHTFAAFAHEEVSLEISSHDSSQPPELSIAARAPVGGARLAPELARGRALFFRANENLISAANLSCAVCHPDGRDDGLVWRFHGSRLRTPFLADRLSDTAPYNWHGTEPTLEGNIRQTVRRLGGKGLPDEDVKALARYLREGLPKPPPGDECNPSLVALGRNVFHRSDVGCAGCHVPEGGFTDGASHDVSSLSAREREEIRVTLAEAATQKDAPPPDGPRTVRDAEQFDTPSLRHLAASPPYFHDGAAPTLAAVVADNRDRMGKTSHLTAHERDALVAYLKSL
jgi:mono/diheme cytochrome c family protein